MITVIMMMIIMMMLMIVMIMVMMIEGDDDNRNADTWDDSTITSGLALARTFSSTGRLLIAERESYFQITQAAALTINAILNFLSTTPSRALAAFSEQLVNAQ